LLGTQLDNVADCVSKGRQSRGEQCNLSRLTEDDIQYIRENYVRNSCQFGTVALARKFGITHQNVSCIVRGTTWKHVQGDRDAMNKCIFTGNLGRDNYLIYTSSGKAICKNSVAVTERWKNSDGEEQEKTTWVRFTIWGKRGEIFAKYTGKGSKVLIEGRLQIDKVDKNGTDVYYTSVTVDDFEFLSKSTGGTNSGSGGAALPDATAGAQAAGLAPAQGAAGLPSGGDWGAPAAGAAALPGADSWGAGAAALPEAASAALVPEEELPW